MSRSLILKFKTGCSHGAIGETHHLVVDKGDSEGLINAIEIVKKKGKEKYAKNCRKRIIENFDSNDRFREYIELYKEILSK